MPKTSSGKIFKVARCHLNSSGSMMLRPRHLVAFILSILICVIRADPPEGFVNELIMDSVRQPMGVKFFPDGSGRFLVPQKNGDVLIANINGDIPPSTEIYLTLECDNVRERGLLDATFDQDFENFPYIYVYFTPLGGTARLSRFTHVELSGGLSSRADSNDEVVLIEDSEGYIDCCHYGGTIAFGPDGKVYLTTGEKFQGAKSQDPTIIAGKVLRVNRDGSIPDGSDGMPPNPYLNHPTNNEYIWNLGLRNPYRCFFDVPTDRFIIGEVGGNQGISREDIHFTRSSADFSEANFGWPLFEGDCSNPDFTTTRTCSDYVDPLFSYARDSGASLTGGMVYRGNQFPSDPYNGAYFYGDYSRGFIRYLTFDPNDPLDVTGDFPFDPDTPSVNSINEGTDGAVYYTTIGGQSPTDLGQVRRFRYVFGLMVEISASPTSGTAVPLVVNFQVVSATSGSGAALTYSWDFGDGNTSTDTNPTHTYGSQGVFLARLTIDDGTNSVISDPIQIEVGNPPMPTITAPADDTTTFRFGDVVTFTATATDVEDGTLAAADMSWQCDFVRPSARHPAATELSTDEIDFSIPNQGQGFSGPVFYECTVVATDSTGLQGEASRRIYPEKVDFTIKTSPPSTSLVTFDGIPFEATFVTDTLINFEHVVGVGEDVICFDNTFYKFSSWSNGVTSEEQTILVPAQDSELTVIYSDLDEECFETVCSFWDLLNMVSFNYGGRIFQYFHCFRIFNDFDQFRFCNQDVIAYSYFPNFFSWETDFEITPKVKDICQNQCSLYNSCDSFSFWPFW